MNGDGRESWQQEGPRGNRCLARAGPLRAIRQRQNRHRSSIKFAAPGRQDIWPTRAKRTGMAVKELGETRCVSENGGGGGNRTRVRKRSPKRAYMLSSFESLDRSLEMNKPFAVQLD